MYIKSNESNSHSQAQRESRLEPGHQLHVPIYRGRVLKELCARVMGRSIAQSNVLIVSSDIVRPASIAHNALEVEQSRDTSGIFSAKHGPAEVVTL